MGQQRKPITVPSAEDLMPVKAATLAELGFVLWRAADSLEGEENSRPRLIKYTADDVSLDSPLAVIKGIGNELMMRGVRNRTES